MDVELTYLAAGLALGKLSDEDRARALDLLDSDPEFRVLAREFDESVPGVDGTIGTRPSGPPLDSSGTQPEDPPQRQRASGPIQQDTGDSSESDQPRDDMVENGKIRPARHSERIAWLLALVATCTTILTIAWAIGLWHERSLVSEEMKAAESDTNAIGTLLSAPDLETVTVDATDDLAFRVFSSVEERTVSVELLGDTPDGRAAQAWVTNDGITNDAGVVDSVDPFLVVGYFRSGDVLSVTIEPLSGSPSPTTEPIASFEW